MSSTEFGPSAYYGHTFSGNICTQQRKHFLGTIEIASAIIRVTWEYDEMKQYPECRRDRVLRRWQSKHLPTLQSCTAEIEAPDRKYSQHMIFCVREYILAKHQVSHIAEWSTRMSGSDSRAFHLGFLVEKLKPRQVLLRTLFRISLSVKFHHISQ